jgi:hypothetical protein
LKLFQSFARIFQKKHELTTGRIKFHSEEVRMFSSPDIMATETGEINWACSMRWEVRNAYRILVRSVDSLVDVCVCGRIVLKRIFKRGRVAAGSGHSLLVRERQIDFKSSSAIATLSFGIILLELIAPSISHRSFAVDLMGY